MSVRDTIRKSKPTVVEYPLPSGAIHIRAFSGTMRAEYMAYCAKLKEGNAVVESAVIAAMAVSEPDGTLAYDYKKAEDVAELAEKIEPHHLDAISLKLFEISGLSEKSSEAAAKN